MPAETARHDPRAEYERRRSAGIAEVERLREREALLANLRLALFLATALMLWLVRSVPVWAVLTPAAAAFIGLMVAHARARRQLGRARRGVEYYELGLERLAYRFAGTGHTGERWGDATHPYAVHLDLFGSGSLYELLCGSRTAAGRETLARWLLAPASPSEARARQGAVRELRDRLDLREDLATLDARVIDALRSDELVAWSMGPATLPSRVWRGAAIGLASAAIVSAGLAPWVGLGPLVLVLLAEIGVWLATRRRVDPVLGALDRPAHALRLARSVLARIEREGFASARLAELEALRTADGPGALEVLEGLLRRVDALEWRRNQMFLPVAGALMWGTNWAYAIERWRLTHGADVERWLRAIGELEALLDLGRYAFERPRSAYPDLLDEGAIFEARAIAHPLLGECVPNDVSLAAERALLVVTGSNMSGKSTLLRTLGVNAVLAGAGAPVRAASLRIGPLALGASIHTVDSLQDGASRFYSEIRAIKRAMDAAGERPPGLFLLDELLHGTNSHDRRIGAESIIRAFLARGAVGVVTTHDLALAEIAEEIGPRAANAHFEFSLEDGELRFDYTLEPGVVRTGNALEIMRVAGLEI